METQAESIDITQLQAFALGLHRGNAPRHARDSSLPGAVFDGQSSPSKAHASTHSQTQRPVSHQSSLQEHGGKPDSQPNGMQAGSLRQMAPQPELSSTIPDSARRRMLYYGTQSQGDTQPASPWVYDRCTTVDPDHRGPDGEYADGDGPQSRDGSEKAVETEQIDLLGAFEQPSMSRPSGSPESAGLEDDGADPLSEDVRADIYPESTRFQISKTPATQGTKRKRGSQNGSQETQTPRLPTNPFANHMSNNAFLEPSQLFKATQALTSPLNAASDGLSDRPSPDMHTMQRRSPPITLSSPIEVQRSSMLRAVMEPQTTYVSMRESQEARDRLKQAVRSAQKSGLEESSDDDFGSIDTQLRKRLNLQKIDKAARDQLAGITARSQPASVGRTRGMRQGGRLGQTHSSPIGSGQQASEAVVISDDPPAEDAEGNITEDETEREEEIDDKTHDELDDLAEENKENVEVPMTVSRLPRSTSQVNGSQPTPSHRPSRRSGRVTRAYQANLATSSPIASRSPERVTVSGRGSQSWAVADSQSSQHRSHPSATSSRVPGKSIGPPSSLDSRVMVPQSQVLQVSKSSSAPTNSNSTPAPDGTSRGADHDYSKSSKSQTQGEAEEGLEGVVYEENEASDADAVAINEAYAARPTNSKDPVDDAVPNDYSTFTTPQKPLPDSAAKTAPTHAQTGPSNASTLFETAQEHFVDSPSKSHARRLLQASGSKISSPSKSQPIRTMSDIIGDPSPPDAIGEIDIDINILSSEDIDFQKAVEGSSPRLPTPKRRQGASGRSVSSIKADRIRFVAPEVSSVTFRGTPRSPTSSAYSVLTPPLPSSETGTRSPRAATGRTPPSVKSPNRPPGGLPHVAPMPLASENALLTSRNAKQFTTEHTSIFPRTRSGDFPVSASRETVSRNDPSKAAQDMTSTTVVAPNRVFAHFNGSFSAYYPASCTGIILGDEPRFEVTFDDGAKDTISASSVKRLDLRAGDVCKIDLPGARTKNFVIEAMQAMQPPVDLNTSSRSDQERPMSVVANCETDIYGHAEVLVSSKQRQSNGADQHPIEQIVVPLTQVYFTQTMWNAIKGREYTFIPCTALALTGLQTPSERTSTPSTPSSRARRIKASSVAVSRPAHDISKGVEALFANMAFSLTNFARSDDLERTKRLILFYGGRILDDGFDELFHVPELSHATSSTTSRDSTLRLTSSAQDLGFTCLIADRHCRRAKYIQALALGIPCLATRWISHCVSKQTLSPIAPFLLPSGESTFLNGAIRSRVLAPFPDPKTTTLFTLVSNRPLMLSNTSILLIMHKHEESTMRHHNLITRALGAARVAKTPSAEAAAQAVKAARAVGQSWDWVYTHDRERETEKVVRGSASASASAKKRKRLWSGDERERSGSGVGSRTRVVGNEYVIQSLILGQLVDA